MNLYIVESPTKARVISKFLGKNNKVLATKGHIKDLPRSRMGVDMETFEPEYITIRGKGDLIKELKQAANKADKVFIATDNDREGEAIAWHVSKALDVYGEKNRVVFNEITKNSILESVKEPREIDLDLVDSQQARRVLDRIVGYSISPLLWKKVKGKLSAGRVQSVALMLICKREEEIANFVPEEYWNIKASFFNDNNLWFDLKQIIENGKVKNLKVVNEIEAKAIEKVCKNNPYKVLENSKSSKQKSPQSPFTTSLLQQEANKRLNFKSSFTMQIAQNLYEGIKIGTEEVGLITYMRTDSKRISPEAAKQAGNYIKNHYGEDYYEGPKNYLNKAKNTQDAHEAIRPTDVYRTPEKMRNYLSEAQYKLYKLIWERFVASQMTKAKFVSNKVTLINSNYVFKNVVNKLNFDGYMKVSGIESGFTDVDLKKFKVGETLNHTAFDKKQQFTKAPARYTEATLIKVLEADGIGRPSTFAPTITTLLNRTYVEIEYKTLKPTELGKIVNEILVEYFPSIINVKFTADLEVILDRIADGKEDWKQAIKDFYEVFEKDLKVAEKEMEKVAIKDEVSDEVCEKCGKPMLIKQGPYGKFLACSGFPDCKNTKPIEDKIGIKCPKCHNGDIVKRKSKRGRVFYGCNKYPECDFASFDLPIEKPCPKCGGVLTERKKVKNNLIKCLNCDYKEEVPRN
ncbi:MAG: type I DNA topoisomerase [Ezakiella sp.]|nr:type I DNA topoisomerase [Ezakiella sp.]